jgi:hypothetical protein
MSGSLRQQSLPSILFLIAGLAFGVRRWFATRPPTPITFVVVQNHYVELSWLGVGVVFCLLYAILYYMAAKFLNLSISLSLSLVHLLITLSAIIGLGQLRFYGVRTEQSPDSYSSARALLAFFGVNAFTLLLVGGLLFLAIVMLSWLLKRPSASR